MEVTKNFLFLSVATITVAFASPSVFTKMKSRITLRVPCKKSNSFPKRHGADYDITSSLGDPGGVVGLAAVLSPTVAIALSGDPGGDFILGGDFD